MLAAPMRFSRGVNACLFVLLAGLALGADEAQQVLKLRELRERMGQLGSQIESDRKRRDAESEKLRSADLAVAERRRALDAVRTQQKLLEARRAQLLLERRSASDLLQGQRRELASELTAAYMIGGEDRLKLWLNQDDAALQSRMSTYYGYFANARARLIASIDANLARLDALQGEIAEQARALDALESEASSQLIALSEARNERKSAVATLRAQVQSASERLARMKREEQSVQAVIESLRRTLPSYSLGARKSFASMRGLLPWPVAGKITVRFHQVRSVAQNGSVLWNGLVISAQPGVKVRAPYYGRVVFADWLQGLGLMLIVDHGGGFLTLFGRSEVLYKKAGDTVTPGDVIAGLHDESDAALYFEIRQGKNPVDPSNWLKRTH